MRIRAGSRGLSRRTNGAEGVLAIIVAGGLLCLPTPGAGQTAGVNQGGPESVHAAAGLNPVPQRGTSESASKVDQMRQAEQRRRIAADTAKLVELSMQLKAAVDRSPNQLSVDVLRKASEIEKTAHDLKGWMTY